MAGFGEYIRIDPPFNPFKDVVDLEGSFWVASTRRYLVTLDQVDYVNISIQVINKILSLFALSGFETTIRNVIVHQQVHA